MSNKIYVWDPLVRIFHWSLVFFYILAYASGDDEHTLHAYAGYAIFLLLAIRIIWGLIGSRYARFSSFTFSPSALMDYLKGFIGLGSGKTYTGHNPAGSWMVIALIVSLMAAGISGLKAYGVEGYGPLATITESSATYLLKVSSNEKEDHDDDEHEEENEEDEFWEELHEFFANLTLLLVLLHISGVMASSMKQRQNLAKAMITGYKKVE